MRNRTMRFSIIALLSVTLAVLSFLGGCETESDVTLSEADSVIEAGDWDQFVDRFTEDHFAAHPLGAVAAGRHEYDGLLPDWSREGISAEISRLRMWRDAALAYDDDTLSETQRFQKRYLISRVRRNLFWLDEAEWPFRNPAFYFDNQDRLDPSIYVMRTYAPPAERMAGLTRLLENLPAAAAQIAANLQGPLPLTYVDYGVALFGGLAAYFRNDLEAAFSDVDDPTLVERFNAARETGAAALAEVVESIDAKRVNATDDFALGPELFARMLQEAELIDLSLTEIERIGLEDLVRNTADLRATCEVYAPEEDVRGCIDKMRANKPLGGPVQAARTQLELLRAHILDQDLVTIPSDEEARVEESPPFARANFAYITPPGPYEERQEAVYYISPPDPSWSDEVQRDYVPGQASLLATSAHEVWPGHFLNILHAKATGSLFNQLFFSFVFAEGWAHYTEELMVDTGLSGGDPEVRVGQLLQALMRNVRLLCAIGMHTGGMTVQQCQDMFQNGGFQGEGTARQQAARGTYDPSYLSYTLGKLMIRQLRDEWSAERGGRAAWKRFHDEFLSFGFPPIPLVQEALLSQ